MKEAQPCLTLDAKIDRLEQIGCLEELEGFTACLRNPPPGAEQEVTQEQWSRLAQMKIAFQKRRSGR